jgi:hypothetical protein
MNMRHFISLCESHLSDAFEGIDKPTLVLPAGTVLFHGTDRPASEWDPRVDPIWGPAWFGADFEVANSYAKFQRSGENGEPYIIQYSTNRSLKLLEASAPEIAAVMDELYDTYMTDEIAGAMHDLGFEGWHIKDTEVMIADGNALDFVKILKVQ